MHIIDRIFQYPDYLNLVLITQLHYSGKCYVNRKHCSHNTSIYHPFHYNKHYWY